MWFYLVWGIIRINAAQCIECNKAQFFEIEMLLVDLDVPFLLRVFKGKAMDVIDREVKKWVEKARNGEI